MRILRIYTQLPPLKGGMEQHIRSLSVEQRKLGHQVSVWFNKGDKTNPDDRQFLSWIALHKIRPQFIGIFLFYIAIFLRCILQKQKFDAVHIHGDWSSFIFGKTIQRRCHAPKLFLSIHGAVDEYKNLKKKLLFSTINKANAVFCTGYQAHEFIQDHCSSHFQPSGLKALFFEDTPHPKRKRFTLISIAHFVAVKNHETLLKIAGSLPDVDFVWVGEGPLKKKLQLAIQKKQFDNILLKGFLSPESIAKELRQAHAFLLTSIAEGTPTALLEAMACGLPIVSSKAGGISALLEEGTNAYFVDDPMDADAFVQRIIELKQQVQKQREMGEVNRKKARSFRWQKVAMNLTRIMQDA
jgi:glycosyltransferase involved in cell wall biosynthesis